MKFSIITPNLNLGAFLPESLESVQRQTVSFEHIIVDGGSNDETHDVLGRYQGRVRVETCESRTPAEAINHGLQFATGDIIGWLSSDDYYMPDALTQVEAYFNAHPDSELVYGHTHEVSEDGEFKKLFRAHPWSMARMKDKCPILPPACFARRSVWEQHGDLDPNLTYWYDYEWFLKLSQAGVRFDLLDRVLGNRRVRLEALRYESACDLQSLKSAEEYCGIQRRLTGGVSVKAALKCGTRRMIVERKDRDTDWEYDRGALKFAYGQLKDTTRFPKTKLFLRHCFVESGASLKRPRFLMRLLPGRLNVWARAHLRHRVFSNNYGRPRPVSIPESYLEPILLENPPRISVVTPNLNQGKFIEATIRSILDQDYPNLDYQVQDGVSSDDSVDVIKQYESSLSHWDSSPDRGQAHAINKGMQHATGEIMAFLNSDDLLVPGSLAYVAQYFQQHPDVDVVYGHRILVNAAGDEISRWVLPPHDDTTIPYADYIPQETMFWRRRAWEAIGEGLDDSFQFALDWDLIIRFRQAGMRFERLPRFLGVFRVTETQKTAALIRTVGEREMRKIRNRVFGRQPSYREIRRHVKWYLRRQWFYDICYKLGLAHY